jgi:hypothetical protein
VDEHRNVEAWADALLDQHRTTPPSGELPVANDPLVKLATTLSGEPPDPLMLERLQRHRDRRINFAAFEAVFMLIGVVLLGAFAWAVLSTF